MNTPTLVLGRDGFSDEKGFRAWVDYVCERVDEACGFEVGAEVAHEKDVQVDRVVRATDEERGTIEQAKCDLWEAFCAGPVDDEDPKIAAADRANQEARDARWSER